MLSQVTATHPSPEGSQKRLVLTSLARPLLSVFTSSAVKPMLPTEDS